MWKKSFYILVFSFFCVALVTTYNNCARTPQVAQEGLVSSGSFKHTPAMASCSSCHASISPGTSSLAHYNNRECASCHFIPPANWAQHSWHQRNSVTANCGECHKKDQPAPVNGVAHYQNMDCMSCHHTPSTTAGGAWSNATPWSHTPVPPSCTECHQRDQPPPVNNVAHYKNMECVNCHHVPGTMPGSTWKYTTRWSHTPVPPSCIECHESDQPPTISHSFNMDCNLCHDTSGWPVE